MKLRLLVLLLIPMMASAQSTPEDLGKEVFSAFQSKDLQQLDSYFPNPMELLADSRKKGIVFEPVQENDFIQNFPLQINRFKHQCNVMFDTELGKKVDWPNTIYTSAEHVERKTALPVDTSKVLESTDVMIHFKDNAGEYFITLSECFSLNDKWVLGGGQVLLNSK